VTSLRAYFAIATAAAQPTNRQSDWRRAGAGMGFEHRPAGKVTQPLTTA